MKKIVKSLVPAGKYWCKCPYSMTPQWITVHNTANDASAANEVKYMRGNTNKISFHFAVDDKQIVQGVPCDRNAFHAGDGSGNGNRKSIAVEICYSKSGGERFEEAEENAAELIAYLMYTHDIPLSRVVRHKDWSGKNCPHRTIQLGWKRFKDMVQDAYDKAYKKTAQDADSGVFRVQVTCDTLNIRAGAGVLYEVVGAVKRGEVFTITEVKAGTWGKLKSGVGWINIDERYCRRI